MMRMQGIKSLLTTAGISMWGVIVRESEQMRIMLLLNMTRQAMNYGWKDMTH